MASSDKRERGFRGKPRPGRRVAVEYSVGDGPARPAYTCNIGVGGAFIATESPEPPGTLLALLLRLPSSEEPVRLRAEVRWNAPPVAGSVAGMGVRFFGLDVEQLLVLNEYFASLAGSEEEPAS